MHTSKIAPIALALVATATAALAGAQAGPDTAATLTIVHKFAKGEGYAPYGGLLVGPDGSFYGTNSEGGKHGRGLVYKLAADGTFTVLHEFGDAEQDGTWPLARPAFGADGMLYGTTADGGNNHHGTVWRVAPDGSGYAVVHAFPGKTFSGGYAPATELLLAGDGNLYGTTQVGGDSPACGPVNGCGTIFRIGTDGSFALVHSFTDAEGSLPNGGLAQMPDGRLAGVIGWGGPASDKCPSGCGAVYAMTLDGQATILHRFDGEDGRQPIGTPVIGASGTLYGVTRFGGLRHFGAEWHVDAGGTFVVDASFDCNKGACRPNVGLSPAPGRYGSTDGLRGSAIVDHNAKVIYPELTASGPLAVGPDGALYGTAVANGGGIFRLQPN